MSTTSVSKIDPFSHEFLANPYPFHEGLREAGPVVWLDRYDIWAMARHEEVRACLMDWETFCSSAGVGLSDFRKETPWRCPSGSLRRHPLRRRRPPGACASRPPGPDCRRPARKPESTCSLRCRPR